MENNKNTKDQEAISAKPTKSEQSQKLKSKRHDYALTHCPLGFLRKSLEEEQYFLSRL